MLKNNIIHNIAEVSVNLIPPVVTEVSILERDQLILESQDTEEDELTDTYQRLPQFKLSERRSKFF